MFVSFPSRYESSSTRLPRFAPINVADPNYYKVFLLKGRLWIAHLCTPPHINYHFSPHVCFDQRATPPLVPSVFLNSCAILFSRSYLSSNCLYATALSPSATQPADIDNHGDIPSLLPLHS